MDDLKIGVDDNGQGKKKKTTRNAVYNEIFRNVNKDCIDNNDKGKKIARNVVYNEIFRNINE